jgi:hypothetical protein
MTVILDLILLERSMFHIRMWKGPSQKDQSKVYLCCVLNYIWIHLCCFRWIKCLCVFIYLCPFVLNSFIVLICLGVDTMAPKDAMKRMKAEHNKKRKLQITTDPTPRKTVSNCAPSLECKCSIQIKIFCGANNLFYPPKNNSLNHCHHPPLKVVSIDTIHSYRF